MTPADLASRLGWLPCEECGQAGFLWVPGLTLRSGKQSCPSCNGIGWLPSPAVLEAMANPEWVRWPYMESARAAWEAQAKAILEREK
jgi:hypothetical protein